MKTYKELTQLDEEMSVPQFVSTLSGITDNGASQYAKIGRALINIKSLSKTINDKTIENINGQINDIKSAISTLEGNVKQLRKTVTTFKRNF